jgi:hypothetical protein
MLFGKAALTAIRLTDGRRANIPAGRAVPENIDPADAQRLLDEGFLTEVEVVDQVVALDPADLQPEGPVPPATPNAIPRGLTADDVAAAAAAEAAATGTEPDELEIPTEPFTDEELAATRELNVDEQLDAVGDNPVKAQQVLDAELERPEEGNGKRRKTLIAGLQDVLDAAEAPEGESGAGQ